MCKNLFHLFQVQNSIDNFLSNSLFADGAASAIVSNEQELTISNSMKIGNIYSGLIFEGINEISWHLLLQGFLIKLAATVSMHSKNDFGRIANEALILV